MDDRPYKLKRPKGLEEYILEVVADNTYLIFNRKENICRCSRCGSWHKISEMHDGEYLKHNEEHWCYDCDTKAICKEERYGRKNITEYGRILWFRKYGRVTFCQLDEYQINYTEIYPQVTFWASAQYRFCKESQEYYKHVPMGFWTDERWEKRKNVKLPEAVPGMWNSYKMRKFEKTVTYISWVGNRGTDLKYANFDMQRLGYRDPDNPYALIGYMYNFLKYPSIEILDKSGFERIVGQKVVGHGCRYINWRSGDLRKILKLDRREIRMFRKTDADMQTLETYKGWRMKGINLELNQVKFIHRFIHRFDADEKIESISKIVDIHKVLKYMEKQEGYVTITDYNDYLKECRKLGYDLENKKILFPTDLEEAHEITSQAVEAENNKQRQEEFTKGEYAVYSKGEYCNDELLIRPVATIDELIEESRALKHCVRTYVDRVCERECAILFIRKTLAPDEPYFTLELSPKGEVVQCRGLQNCSYPPEIAKFIKTWKTDVLKKKAKKGAAASAA